jgi:hypothetical protein
MGEFATKNHELVTAYRHYGTVTRHLSMPPNKSNARWLKEETQTMLPKLRAVQCSQAF